MKRAYLDGLWAGYLRLPSQLRVRARIVGHVGNQLPLILDIVEAGRDEVQR